MSKNQQSILGLILLQQNLESQKQILNHLTADFFEDETLEVFKLIKEKVESKTVADVQNLKYKDENQLCYYIATSSQSNTVKSALKELLEEYKKRELKKLSDLKTVVEVKNKLNEMDQNSLLVLDDKILTIQEVLSDTIIKQAENPIDLENLPKTGFKDFDDFFKGFMPQNLITIGGYSGIGKSTLIFSLIKNLSFTHPTLIFNLEMPNSIMTARILSSISGVPFIYTANLGNEQVQENIDRYGQREKLDRGVQRIEKLKLKMVDDNFDLAIILSKIRQEAKKDVKFVLIDYLQLIKPINSNKQRHLEVAEITRELKLLAKELNISIILLAQLGRASLNKNEPELSDLRESGSIEQDSDTVFLIYKKDNERHLKLAKDRMFGQFTTAKLNYNVKTQSYE